MDYRLFTTQLVFASVGLLTAPSFGQCGNLPNISTGIPIFVIDMPSPYETVELASGVMVFPWALFSPHVGDMMVPRLNVIDLVAYTKIGTPREVDGTTNGGIVRNSGADCLTKSYAITYTNLVSTTESWSINSVFGH